MTYGYKMSEIGNIPETWDVISLGEVSSFFNGKGHEQVIAEGGKYIVVNSKFVSTNGLVKKFCDKNLSPLTKGDIAIVMSDIPNGKAIAKCFLIDIDERYTLNQRIGSIRAKGIDNKFLYYILNRNKYYLAFDNGVGQTNLRKEEVLACPIPLPPIQEQQKIVEILSVVDDKINIVTKQIAETARFKQGLIHQLLTRGIGYKRLKHCELGEIPETWGVVTFDKLADNITAKFKSTEGRCVDLEHVEQVTGKLLGSCKISDKASQKNHFRATDVLFGKLRPYLRKFWYATFEGGCTSELMIFRAKHDIDSKFIYYTIQQDSFIANSISKSFGTKMPRTSWDIICEFKLPLPSFEEQKEITEILTAVDDKIEILNEKKKAYKDLKAGLMQQLLTGKLRVNIHQQQSAIA